MKMDNAFASKEKSKTQPTRAEPVIPPKPKAIKGDIS